MSRKPIYQKDDSKLRIISVPNGMWQAQKATGLQNDMRTNQAWADLGKARSQADAMAQINILAKATRAA